MRTRWIIVTADDRQTACRPMVQGFGMRFKEHRVGIGIEEDQYCSFVSTYSVDKSEIDMDSVYQISLVWMNMLGSYSGF